MHEYRFVLSRMRLGMSDREIAKGGLMGRRKAAALRALADRLGWLDPDTPLPDEQALATHLSRKPSPRQASELTPYRDEIRRWWIDGIQGTTIHDALQRKYGYRGSYSSVRRFLQALKKAEPSATVVLDFKPGDAAQVDFGKGPEIVDVHTGEVIKTWFFVMTLAWSRHQYAELVPHQDIETWLGCHRRAFEHFSGVPQRVIIDNPKCAITKACYTDPLVQRSYHQMAEEYGFQISPCPVADPKKKGRVESGVKFVKNRFAPLRVFRDLADANAQLATWVMDVGNRDHGTTREKPLTRFVEIEQALLRPLPDKAPELLRWARCKLHGDCHVQIDKVYYSAPWRHVGQQLDISLSETIVRIYRDHELLAMHPRAHRPGERETVLEHYPPEYVAWQMRDPKWCVAQAAKVGEHCSTFIHRLLGDRVVERLRGAQGVLRLRKSYGDQRLNAACERALRFDNIRYQSVKAILDKGLDQLEDTRAFDALADTYTGGGRFTRASHDLFEH